MILQKPTSKLVHDSILVAGDAAGLADALMKGGIDSAMYSAKWGAEVLKEALARILHEASSKVET